MVKGVCRRVIIVRSPDTKLFEQAVFLMREDAPEMTDDDVLRQACLVAERSAHGRDAPKKTPRRRWRSVGWMLLGAAVMGLAWVLCAVLR